MKSEIARILPLVAVLGAGGCATDGPKQETGMVVGGVLGGILGAQVDRHRTAAIIAGTLIGSAIGGSIGKTMDDVDRMKTAQTLEGVRTGVSSTWRNPDSGVRYTVTPTRTYMTETGPCREFTTEAVIGGRKESVYGTACRQPDGSWKVQS